MSVIGWSILLVMVILSLIGYARIFINEGFLYALVLIVSGLAIGMIGALASHLIAQ